MKSSGPRLVAKQLFLVVVALPVLQSKVAGFRSSSNLHRKAENRNVFWRAPVPLTNNWNAYPLAKISAYFMGTSSSDSSGKDSDNSPKVRFADTDVREEDLGSVLGWIVSDIGSVTLGSIGLLLVLLGRLLISGDSTQASAVSMGEETRVNLLAVLACGSVLLNGLSKLDVTTALAETVQLAGTRVDEPVLLFGSNDEDTNEAKDMSWLIQAILSATPAETCVILRTNDQSKWNAVAYGGILPPTFLSTNDQTKPDSLDADSTPILNRFLQQREQESYLPTLQALPGRSEFESYLPGNTQAVLLVPFTVKSQNDAGERRQVLVLGGNQARSFTPRDIAWCQTVVRRVSCVC